jgi:hypothetical protein
MFGVLRVGVGIVGGLLLAIGLLLLAGGGIFTWSGIQLVVLGAVAVVIAFFEKLRYGSNRGAADRGRLRPTDERFVDPSTGERTRVWIDPASGEREYLPDAEPSTD